MSCCNEVSAKWTSLLHNFFHFDFWGVFEFILIYFYKKYIIQKIIILYSSQNVSKSLDLEFYKLPAVIEFTIWIHCTVNQLFDDRKGFPKEKRLKTTALLYPCKEWQGHELNTRYLLLTHFPDWNINEYTMQLFTISSALILPTNELDSMIISYQMLST